MTREDWIKTYRWVRQTRKELQNNDQRLLAAALICTNERIKQDIMDSLIFPPLLFAPNTIDGQEFDFRPGAISYVR